MAAQDINIRFSLKDDLSVNLKGITKSLENTGNIGSVAGNKVQTSLKGVIHQARSMILPFRQVGFILGATIGAAGASIMNVANNLDEMDAAASRLGTTTADLSVKLYGFNVANDSVRSGIGLTKGLMQDAQAGFMIMGAGIAGFMSNISAQVASWQTGVKKEEILKEMAAKKVYTLETAKMEVSLSDEIKKITMSETGFKRQQLERQIADYRRMGVDELLIAKRISAEKMQIAMTHATTMNNLLAEQYRLAGDKVGSLRVTQMNEAAANAPKLNTEEWTLFKKNQETALAQMKFSASAMGEIMNGVAGNMTTSLGSAFADAAQGFKNLKDIARDFGNSLIQTISNAIAKLILMKTIGAAMSPMTGGINIFGMFHQGGVVRKAHSGMRLGNDEVPIVAQAGEGIISRKGMRSLGAENFNKINRGQGAGGSQTILVFNNSFWDSRDVERNKETLVNAVVNGIRKNGAARQAIREYS